MNDNGNGGEDADTDATEPALQDIPLSLDAMLDILANRPRRDLLTFLQEQPEESAAFEEVTNYILTQMSRELGKQPNHDDVQVELQHHHLPKLADAGVIEYDIRSQTIRYRENEPLEELHDRIKEFQAD